MEKRWRTPLLLYLAGAHLGSFQDSFYFWLAEKLCHEKKKKNSKRFGFSFFFFCWDQEMLLAENKWWTLFFESPTDWFSSAVWEVLALFIIFLRHPYFLLQHQSQSTMCGDSLSSSYPLWTTTPPPPPSNTWVILWTQCSLLWCLIVCENINITLVILLTHILQMGEPFLHRMKRQFTGGKLDDGKQICNATG